jgi:hypothetical protein
MLDWWRREWRRAYLIRSKDADGLRGEESQCYKFEQWASHDYLTIQGIKGRNGRLETTR